MNHDLHDYMRQLTSTMEAEYARIQKTSVQDPGTAGDEGEENWAALLRAWLPPAYSVVTKGQLLDEAGSLSPQCDVLVLKPSYPPALRTRKKYLLAGIAAVFECKLTLKKRHVLDAAETASIIKRMSKVREGSPYRELVVPPLYGLIAHSHSSRRGKSKQHAMGLVEKHLTEADLSFVSHPREMIDLVCIADTATWVTTKDSLTDPRDVHPSTRARMDAQGEPSAGYMCHSYCGDGVSVGQFEGFSPIGVFLCELLVKLAWEDPSLRDIARYFVGVEFSSSASGMIRSWSRDIYSPSLRRRISLRRLKSEVDWDEWSASIQ